MTRLCTEGFEMGDFLGFTTNQYMSSETPEIVTNIVRGGVYAAKIPERSSGVGYGGGLITKAIPGGALTEGYARVAFYITTTNTPSNNPGLLELKTSATTRQLLLTINKSTRKLELRGCSSLLATGTQTIQLNSWYVLEVHFIISDTTGVFQVRLDGGPGLDIDYSGNTRTDATYGDVGLINIGRIYAVASALYAEGGVVYSLGEAYFDDFAIDDAEWCGPGSVVCLKPNADGATTDWIPSTGTDNYAMVDDIPADNDTTYVTTATNDVLDVYDLTSAPSDLAGKLIKRVWVEARARKTDAVSNVQLKLGVDSGTASDSDPQDLNISYNRVMGPEILLNPNNSLAWEYSDLADLKVRVKASVT